MILVDNQIREKIRSCKLIENYNLSNVKNVLYDLTADKFIERGDDGNQEHSVFDLAPQQSTVIATKELINLPNNMIARIVGKNSRIRQGLLIDAPLYQPGHYTRVYFRITNISNSTIQLISGHSYASIVFEELEHKPDTTYDGTFQGEINYNDLGDYSSEYSNEVKTIEKKFDKFKNFEKSVYANVITILTIFIAIFSIINVNVELASSNAQNWIGLLLFNLCTVGSISLLANIVLCHLSSDSFKSRYWIIPILCFLGALVCIVI